MKKLCINAPEKEVLRTNSITFAWVRADVGECRHGCLLAWVLAGVGSCRRGNMRACVLAGVCAYV